MWVLEIYIKISQAFLCVLQMFVRLFVDENLDRTVPISKQPKDKIQAILEACDRQFAEFHDRSRKRVRTYLKSCRRLKKSKDGGFEPVSDSYWTFWLVLPNSTFKMPTNSL